jgi:hypothetical protein
MERIGGTQNAPELPRCVGRGVQFAAEQLEAEQAQRRLWSGSFIPPWRDR